MAATYTAGPVSLLPFDRLDPPEDWDEITKESVPAALDDFIGVDGNPISTCTVVSVGGRILLEDYPEAGRIETLRDYVELACVVCLSGREFLTTAEPYCNSDCFSVYQRQYRRGWGTSAPPIRRRDDIPMGLSGLALKVHAPKHTVPIMKLSLEEAFFKALSELRRKLIGSGRLELWARLQESIFCFNQANTDSEAIPPHIEWVLMASAIQRILNTPSKADVFARQFRSELFPNDSKRRKAEMVETWAREFYRYRGNYAHGQLRPYGKAQWPREQHLLCGAIAFPLLLKILLQREGVYRPTTRDAAQADALARLLEELKDPTMQLRSWHKYIEDEPGVES
jgi:hypothetical protein